MKLKIIYSFLFCTCFTFFTLSQERECNDILTIDSTIIPPEAKAKSREDKKGRAGGRRCKCGKRCE